MTGDHQNTHVSVVGLGYVGLTLAVHLDETGYETVGYDIDERKVDALAYGRDPIGEFGDSTIVKSDISFTNSPEYLRRSDYVHVSLPTPLDETEATPDLSGIEAACETIGRYISDGAVVVIESTLYPGATCEVLRPAIERGARAQGGVEFGVGYSPERIVPGGEMDFSETTKIVSAEDQTILDALGELYDNIVDAGVYLVESIETAEASKCLENVQRDVNIGLINEFTRGCRQFEFDLDPHAVIAAAKTKWNFHDYSPGIVGGHCIPVDPHYLRYKFEQSGFTPDILRSARTANQKMVDHVCSRTVEALTAAKQGVQTAGRPSESTRVVRSSGDTSGAVADARVLLLGFGYKPNASDVRNSGVRHVADTFVDLDLAVQGYDPFHDARSVPDSYDFEVLSRLQFDDVDAIVVLTPHEEFQDLHLGAVAERMNDDPVLVDVGNAFEREEAQTNGFTYRRL